MRDLTGQQFGGYELSELIGAGGAASIYKAFDDSLSRWVAIKVVPIQVEGGGVAEVLLARFRLEAKAIAALRHRNILTIYGYGEERSWAYIVMEYVPGGSLKDRMTPGTPFDWQRALNVIIPVSQALAFAHDRGIIHRDIKPANILMPQEDWPLLADFGLAKMKLSDTMPNLTIPGQVLGTMAYAAPEQIQEDVGIDARVDIYSLGIVLYELLTGRLPFEGETAFDFLMARLVDPPVPATQANPDIPGVFVPLLNKALAQAPDDRYPSMEALAQALVEARYELSGTFIRRGRPASRPLDPDRTALVNPNSPANVRLKVTASGEEITLPANKTELIVGRSHKEASPDIDLAPYGGSKAGVSRRHSRLVQKAGEWFIEDLNSTNGTFINGLRLRPQQTVVLKNGDIVRCGQVELEFEVE